MIFTPKSRLNSIRKMIESVGIAMYFLVFFYAIVVGNVAKVDFKHYFIGIFLSFFRILTNLDLKNPDMNLHYFYKK